jgi:hypothetical protein
MGALPPAKLGAGGGLLATARNVGMVVGVSLGGALFAAFGKVSFVRGWRTALLSGAALAAAGGLLAIVKPDVARAAPRRPGG